MKVLGVVVLALAHGAVVAACAQITTWSTADQSYFPVPRVIRVDRGNTPGPYFFLLDDSQDRSNVTFFSLTAGPSLVRDRLFANDLSIGLVSYRDAAAAHATFTREVELFTQLNPLRWGYSVLSASAATGELIYYADTPGSRQLFLEARREHVILRVRVQSASAVETAIGDGLPQAQARVRQAWALVDAKCGVVTGNRAPTVALSTSNGSFTQDVFQQEMAAGTLTLAVGDPDGISELDYNTLRVTVEGVDKTAHVLSVINTLASQGRVRTTNSATAAIYQLALDRKKLMDEHNLFNIAWNGWWNVTLRLCDHHGACGENSYRLYFGPFLAVTHFEDRRCFGSPAGPITVIVQVVFGNNGYDAQTLMLVALGPSADFLNWRTGFWSLTTAVPGGGLGWLDAASGLVTVMHPVPTTFVSGDSAGPMQVPVPFQAFGRAGELADIPAGNHTLVFGAMDIGVINTPYWSGTRPVTLCRSP